MHLCNNFRGVETLQILNTSHLLTSSSFSSWSSPSFSYTLSLTIVPPHTYIFSEVCRLFIKAAIQLERRRRGRRNQDKQSFFSTALNGPSLFWEPFSPLIPHHTVTLSLPIGARRGTTTTRKRNTIMQTLISSCFIQLALISFFLLLVLQVPHERASCCCYSHLEPRPIP